MNWRQATISRRSGKPQKRYLKPLAEESEYKGQLMVLSEWGGWGIAKFNPIVNRPKICFHLVPYEYAFIGIYRDFIEHYLMSLLSAAFVTYNFTMWKARLTNT